MAKILIADDSDILRSELKEILIQNHHDVIEAENGAIGLQKAKENKDINLVISDLNMPQMNGLIMCSEIRSIAELSKIPIFMLTTETSAELKIAGKQAGINVWVIKPFKPQWLIGAISKVLGL